MDIGVEADKVLTWVEHLFTLALAFQIGRKGMQQIKVRWRERRLKKIDRLTAQRDAMDELVNSPTQALGVIGEGLTQFLFCFFILVFLFFIAKEATSPARPLTGAEIFFRVTLVVEITFLSIAEYLVCGRLMEVCRYLKNPVEGRKKLTDKIQLETKLHDIYSIKA